MKSLLLVLSLLFSTQAMAGARYQFMCETDSKIKAGAKRATIHRFEFTLTEKNGEYDISRKDVADDEIAVKTKPESSQLYVFGVLELSRVKSEGGRLKFFGNDIDIIIGDMELYENSHWTTGWVRTINRTDPKDKGSYSTVSCIVRTL